MKILSFITLVIVLFVLCNEFNIKKYKALTMRLIIFSILTMIVFVSCQSSYPISDPDNKATTFYDQNNTKISKAKFDKILSTFEYLDVPGEQPNSLKLVAREDAGKISNITALENALSEKLNVQLDAKDPTVIIYYPGPDVCNQNGLAVKDKNRMEQWYNRLEMDLKKLGDNIQVVYIYKNKKGLNAREEARKWHKDPAQIVETTFFKHHYPCSSFVVFSKSGAYKSYFGEFSKEQVWNAAKELMYNQVTSDQTSSTNR